MGILVFLVGGVLIAAGLFGGRTVTRQTRTPLMGLVTRVKVLVFGLVLVTLVLMSCPRSSPRGVTQAELDSLFGSAATRGASHGGAGAAFDSASTDSAVAAP